VFRGSNVTAGASAGVALLYVHSDADRALDEADRAMYEEKRRKPSRYTARNQFTRLRIEAVA